MAAGIDSDDDVVEPVLFSTTGWLRFLFFLVLAPGVAFTFAGWSFFISWSSRTIGWLAINIPEWEEEEDDSVSSVRPRMSSMSFSVTFKLDFSQNYFN